MIFDILERVDFDLQKAIFDNYILKDGLYIKIGEKIEYFIFKNSQKEEKKQLLFTDLDGNIKADKYEWFVKRDYLSNYLNSNKAIDPPKKRIHNNNYLTLFVKEKEFIQENQEYFLSKLYDTFKDFSSFTKKQEKEILKSFNDYVFDENRLNDIELKKSKLKNIYEEILSKKEYTTNYIKIFFDDDIEKYKKESEIYYALKIYNKIETTKIIDNKIYGLSDFNMGLNAKKPYLEHKTRGFTYPFMVEKDKIFEIKKLFDYLKSQKELYYSPKKDKIGLYLHKHNENDQAVIDDFDIVVYTDEMLPKTFIYKNYLLLKQNKQIIQSNEIKDFNNLFALINEVLFNNALNNNLYGDVYSKLPNHFQNLIYLTRDIAKNLLKRDIDSLFRFLKFSESFIVYYVRQNNLFQAGKVINLVLSIKEYKGENVDILNKLNEIEEKVLKLKNLDDNEWYILAGQVIKYLLDKSKKSDKKADMIEPFLRAGKTKKLKQEIEMLYFKYKHDIPLNFIKLNNAISLIMANEENKKVDKEKLLIGLLSENIFYKKEEK